MTKTAATGRRGRLVAGFLGLTFLPFLLIADTMQATGKGWSPSSAGALGKLAVPAGLFVAACAAALLVRSFREMLRLRAGQWWLLSLSTLSALAVGDFALRRITPQPAFHTRPAGKVYSFDPNSFALPGVFEPAKESINSQGVRGPQLPPRSDAYRILCIGGGTTECSYLDDAETWPALLMKDLDAAKANSKAWVGSVGYAEFATGHHLQFLRESPLLAEMDCVVITPGVNDFIRLLLGMDMGQAQPPFWLQTGIIANLKEIWNVRLGQGYVLDSTGDGYLRRQLGLPMPPRPIDVEDALDAYEQRIKAIAEAAKARKLRVVFVSQPAMWDDFLTPFGNRRLRLARLYPYPREWEYASPGNFKEALLKYNDRLKKAAESVGAEFVDVASPMNTIEMYFYDDYHLNEGGCAELARRLAQWFLTHPPFKK